MQRLGGVGALKSIAGSPPADEVNPGAVDEPVQAGAHTAQFRAAQDESARGRLAHINHLPIEVMNLVLDHLSESDLQSWRQTSWAGRAQVALHRQHLTIRRSQDLQAKLEEFRSGGLKGITLVGTHLGEKFEDEHLQWLAQQAPPELESFALTGAYHKHITDAGVAHLAGHLKSLKHLDLSRCPALSDASLESLTSLKNLIVLKLRSCRGVTDVGIEHLKDCPLLRCLDLSNCDKLTDKCVPHLLSMAALTEVDLRLCEKLTGAGITQLRARLEKVQLP